MLLLLLLLLLLYLTGHRRVPLSALRFVNEVVIGAPSEITADMIRSFNIGVVVKGTTSESSQVCSLEDFASNRSIIIPIPSHPLLPRCSSRASPALLHHFIPFDVDEMPLGALCAAGAVPRSDTRCRGNLESSARSRPRAQQRQPTSSCASSGNAQPMRRGTRRRLSAKSSTRLRKSESQGP